MTGRLYNVGGWRASFGTLRDVLASGDHHEARDQVMGLDIEYANGICHTL